MLHVAIQHLVSISDCTITKFFRNYFDCSWNYTIVVADTLEFHFSDGTKEVLTDTSIMLAITRCDNSELIGSVLWVLCEFFDDNWNLFSEVRLFVQQELEIDFGFVPFFFDCNKGEIVTQLSKFEFNTENIESSEKVSITLDTSSVSVRLPLETVEMRQLLSRRLRRLLG